MPITRSTWSDDDGSGTLGTLVRNAELQAVYDNIDAAVWDPAQLVNISDTPLPGLSGWINLVARVLTTTTYRINADFVQFRDPTAPYGTITKKITGTDFTVDITAAGPVINGRDQAGAFSSSSWVYFYLIVKSSDGTMAGIVSTVAPPTGPTLPSGYDQWAFVSAARLDGSVHLISSRTFGNKTFYDVRQSALAGGTAGSATSVSLSALVPPSACAAYLDRTIIPGSGVTAGTATIQHVSGSDFSVMTAAVASGGDCPEFSAPLEIPLTTAQTIYYKVTGVIGGSVQLAVWVLGYCVPNGAN